MAKQAAPWLWWLLALASGCAVWLLFVSDSALDFAADSPVESQLQALHNVPRESPFQLDSLLRQSGQTPPTNPRAAGITAEGPLDDFAWSGKSKPTVSKSKTSAGASEPEVDPVPPGDAPESGVSAAVAGAVEKEDWAEAAEAAEAADGGETTDADSLTVDDMCNDAHPNADDPNMLHVVFASDLNQVEGVQASVTSVVTSAATPDLLTVHIMVRAIWAKEFKKAFGLRPECRGAVTVTGVLIRVHEVPASLIERSLAKVSAAVKKERGALDTMENFARFYMHLVLESASVVVYLDADTIVQADLGQLRQQLIDSGRTVGFVAREHKVAMEKFLRKPKNCVMRDTAALKNLSVNWNTLMKKNAYNVGVFALDLKRWKSSGAVERVEQFIKQHNDCNGALWVGGSQPPLLLAFHHRPKDAPQDFIVFDAAWNVGDLGWRDKMDKEKLKKKYVLHWNGNKKPWRADGLYKDLWRPHRDKFSSLLQPYESGEGEAAPADAFSSTDIGKAAAAAAAPADKSDKSKSESGRRRRRTTTTMSPLEMAERAKCPAVDLISEWTDGAGLPCAIGRTYGCSADNKSMWTKGGCSGAFLAQGSVTACSSVSNRDRPMDCKPGTLPTRSSGFCGLMVVTTFFTTKKDWQRGKFAKAQFNKIKILYVSAMKQAVKVTVVYDDLPQELIQQYTTPLFSFYRVNLTDFEGRYGVNDVRYFFFQRLLKEHKDWTSMFIVDAFDVRIGMDMCPSIKDDMLYLGIEMDKLKNHPWMKARFHKMSGKYKQWYTSKVDAKMKILNCGLTGGKREIMLKLLKRMTEVITDPSLPNNQKGEDVNVNMAALNFIVYNEFPSKYTGGAPVHSLYKRFQNKRTDVWFIHK